ncbi:glycine dehydrogenase (aminomethyl-transferring) [Neopusillimonas maritima]|uniref:Glycine dehydrogenase (decarboxylating) n=2 Tax=Neopusillimonas maritima TaxID=2026239 RepID=A0A3A1YWY8_9BURK|nr:aminomethyl-transferring glycine dehydrogenase [Neopusillimonas maritima]RIY41350.1 glycine dehydrogenase (aminomethyl-transferring) [Neopusillimonas maritima]
MSGSTPLHFSALHHLLPDNDFVDRHVGINEHDREAMLAAMGGLSLDGLIEQTVPADIRLTEPLDLDDALSEPDALGLLRSYARQNRVNRSFIGMGYYNTHVPPVILRNVLENPGWYTAYTPYQPEISQGRLEALLNFQQMTMDLTGLPLANASLLDEATAAAEAMALSGRASRKKTQTYFVAVDVHPQTVDVLQTRARYYGFDVVVDHAANIDQYDVFGVLLQYPGTYGDVPELEPFIAAAKSQQALVSVASDLMALVLLRPPGAMGADIVFGSSQRFGVPMGFGGPHAAFFATTDALRRMVPGRVIGVSVDQRGKTALRMAMQTREQHIRREKATSNICTAQALLANMASLYAVYHGPKGLKKIAERIHRLTRLLAAALAQNGFSTNASYFDTLCVTVGDQQAGIYQRALDHGMNLRRIGDGGLGISLDETTTLSDVADLLCVFTGKACNVDFKALDQQVARNDEAGIKAQWRRTDAFLSHPVFNRYHSETEMLRYLKRLENKDYSLVHGMIPLGSCTMKLNAVAEMMPVSWPEFAQIHPFAPEDQTRGYRLLLADLEHQLAEITGYDAVSLQPNSGAQGEYAGLLAIRKYHESIGQGHRDVCLIPSSAHGTNPASAAMMGMRIVMVACDDSGNVDIDDLAAKAKQYANDLSSLMITYPSTHGVFEARIVEVCDIVHRHGGQVYLDGANMNAQVGLSKPGLIGADVSHLNLHKTFAIPHGGGGPGMGPIGVKKHVAPFLPSHKVVPIAGLNIENGAVSASPYGSGCILPISWMYIRLLGRNGLVKSTQNAILAANYIAEKLAPHYPVLYRGVQGRVAHECILDIRPLKEKTGVTEEDIAKRLMDYGFHAPTMSFPVAGTLMIEPTESESKLELDRFIEAMIGIRAEIDAVASGHYALEQSPLRLAPHTAADLVDVQWDRPYTRETAVFPTAFTQEAKFWPAVNRVDNVYGDRNFVCSCPGVEAFAEAP